MSKTYPAIVWNDLSSNAHNRMAEVDIDASIDTDWSICLNGTDRNGDFVRAKYVVVDNLTNPVPVYLNVGIVNVTISPYTRSNIYLGNNSEIVQMKSIGGLVFLYFSERELGIPNEQNQLAASQGDFVTYLRSDGIVPMVANFDFGTFKGINLAYPTLATDASNKKYVDDYTQKFDAKKFGGSWDGLGDDTAAIQAAIDAAAANGSGNVIIPEMARINSQLLISTPRISFSGKGAGATQLLLGSPTQKGIVLKGADIHSIELAHFEAKAIGGNGSPQTANSFISFEIDPSNNGCLDVKIHHFTTFYMYDVIGTAASNRVSATPFLDIVVTDFNMRDTKHRGIHATMMAGLKLMNHTIGFTNPQGLSPMAGSACIYIGDWVDGYWLGQGNILGGETCIDFGSDWGAGGRKPAQGQTFGLSADSGWLNTLRIRGLFNGEFHGMLVGDLAGAGDDGIRIDGGSSGFTSTKGVDGCHFYGGWAANNKGAGMSAVNNVKDLYFHGMKFLNAGQQSNNTYNNAYIGPNISKFGFFECMFDNNSWFGTNKAAYALFIDTGCNDYHLKDNRFNAANHGTGGLFNGSSGAALKYIADNAP